MAFQEFDVFVIGTGRSGKDVANACADAGWKVAIADKREFGGVCANRGCDPKKVLVAFTEILKRSKQMKGKGIQKNPTPDWSELQKFKHTFTDAVPYVHEKNLKEKGITLFHQSPKFLDKNTLSVEGKTVKAKKIVIATGQIPRPIYFEGNQYLLKSEDFLNLEKLPKRMAFIGAGLVGMECAHIAARMGVEVCIIHAQKRPLNNFDSDMVDYLVEVSKNLGIEFLFEAQANKIEKTKSGLKVFAEQKGKTIHVETEMVFNAAGRIPSIADLDLEKGEVSFSDKGVEVNEKLQNPSNKNVYACGDVSASPGKPLTPLAPYESKIVISQLLDKNYKKIAEYPPQPSAVFTWPPVASIGLSEEEAKEKYKNVQIKKREATKWYSAKHLNDEIYAFKTIINKTDGKILGAHMIGTGAAEIINIFSLAMANGLNADEIKNTIFAYPTWGMDIQSMI